MDEIFGDTEDIVYSIGENETKITVQLLDSFGTPLGEMSVNLADSEWNVIKTEIEKTGRYGLSSSHSHVGVPDTEYRTPIAIPGIPDQMSWSLKFHAQ